MDGGYTQVIGLFRSGCRTDLFVFVVQVRNENDALCAVLFRIDGFVDERCVAGEVRSIERALRIRFLRFMAQHQDYLSSGVDILIVIVVKLWSGDSVARENKRTVE